MNIRSTYKTWQQGVTLIEMIVVIAIIAMVSSIILFNYSDFSTNVTVRNLAQEIALAVRKSQSYATSVRAINTRGLLSDTYPGYGISFSTADAVAGAPSYATNVKQFVLFAEADGGPNGLYDDTGYSSSDTCGQPDTDRECIESFGIATSDRIVQICTDQYGCDRAKAVDITFRRPNPDALFCVHDSRAGGNTCLDGVGSVTIVIESAKGLQRSIVLYNTGQISVK